MQSEEPLELLRSEFSDDPIPMPLWNINDGLPDPIPRPRQDEKRFLFIPAGAKLVAIADGGPASGIVVSRSSESFGLLDEGESGIAQSHGLLQGAAGG